MTSPSPAPLTDAAALERITANLDAYIDARAAELAAPQIAEVRAELEQSRKETAAAQQRYDDFRAEVHRQIAVLVRQVAEAREAAADRLAALAPEQATSDAKDAFWRAAAITRSNPLSLPASKETQQ